MATHELLKAYGIPSAPVMHARDAHEAMDLAQPLLERGASVALKILSPDIPHKSEVDGVRLNLTTLPAVQSAANAILSRARQLRPDARIDGLLVQPTIVRPKARELIVGIADDATFGPVIVVGRGGTAVEVINDKALALPPLDLRLAHELIGQTRASRILKAYGDVPAADERALALALVKLAQLAADIPEVRTLDINPLLVDGKASSPSTHVWRWRRRASCTRAVVIRVFRCSRTRRSGSAPSNCPMAAAPSCVRCGRRTTRCSVRSSPASATRTCACVSSSR